MVRDYLHLPRAVYILCLGTLINRAGAFFVVFVTIYVSEELNFGISFATLAMGVMGIGSMVASAAGGHLVDSVGRRPVMLGALFGGALMLVFLSLATQRWSLLLAVLAFSLCYEMFRPAVSAMIGDLVTSEQRPHAFGLMYISINLGFALAPLLGGLLAEISFQWLFWADALTTFAYGLIVLWLIQDTRPEEGEISERHSFRKSVALIVADRTFLTFCLASLLMGLVFMQGMSTLPLFIRSCGATRIQFGALMSINGVLIVVGQLPLIHWLNRFERVRVLTVGGVLIALGFGLNAWAHGLWFIAMTTCIWTLGEMFQAPYQQAIVTDLAPPELRGRYLGLFSMCYSSALTVGAPLGGLVLEQFGPQSLWALMFSVAMVSVALYALQRRSIVQRSVTAPVAS